MKLIDITGGYCFFEVDYTEGNDAVLLSPTVLMEPQNSEEILCLSFWYSMFGADIGSLTVYLESENQAEMFLDPPVFTTSGQHTGRRSWQRALIDISNQTSDFKVVFRGIKTNDGDEGDMAFDDVGIYSGACQRNLDFNCDFEDGTLCGWMHSKEDLYLLTERGDTLSVGTGPDFDKTKGDISGTYLYLEASDSATGESGTIVSPLVETRFVQNRTISFWYNMYGGGMGALRLFVESAESNTSEQAFVVQGQQTDADEWLQAVVEVTNAPPVFSVYIKATRGTSFQSDISIDDIKISPDIDTEAPVVTCPCTLSTETDTGRADAAVTWTSSPSATDYVDTFNSSDIHCTDTEGNVAVSGGMYGLGTTNITCNATDTAMNTGSCSFSLSVRDKEAPVVTCPNTVTTNTDTGTADAAVTWTSAPSATDNVDTFTLSDIGCADTAGNIVVSGGVYRLGTTNIVCNATDAAMNVGSCNFSITIRDGEAPVVSCPDTVNMDTEKGKAHAAVSWTSMPSATDNVDTFTSSDIRCTDTAGNVVLSGGRYELGTTRVTCSASDAAGKNGSCQFSIEVVDSEPPNVTCPDTVTMKTSTGRADAAVTWTPLPTSTDNVDLLTSSDIECVSSEGFAVVSRGLYGVGNTTVTCSATDAARNIGSCQFTIQVVDKEPPQIICPNGVASKRTDVGMPNAVVTWTPMPSATDNVDIFTSSDIQCLNDAGSFVVSGGVYNLGTTTVTCNATDAGMNAISCQFTIEIIDKEPPALTCPITVTMDTDKGRADAAVTWTLIPSATDNVDTFTSSDVRCTNTAGNVVVSGGMYGLGTTRVTCSASDAALNTGSCQFIIEVVDSEPPHVTCPDTVTMTAGTGRADATVAWTSLPKSTDNVDHLTLSDIECVSSEGFAVVSRGLYGVGNTTVTCSVTDSARNIGSCQFTIVVVDREPPQITCPNEVTSKSTDIGMPNAAVVWSSMPSATDNVDIFTLSDILCSDDLGSVVVSSGVYELGLTTVTCTVTDGAMNAESCQFTIDVIDTEVPSISCPDSVISVSAERGQSTASVTWIQYLSANDNVDSLTLSDIRCENNAGATVVSGGMYGLGSTTVICSVTDGAMNTGSCQFTIEVAESNINGAVIAIAASTGAVVFGSIVAIGVMCVHLMRRVPGYGLSNVLNSFSNQNVEWEERPREYRRSAKYDIQFYGQEDDSFPRQYVVPGPAFVGNRDGSFNDAFYY
ncbi:hyalin-like [Acanthaster planci]|uniref:Hyalin-like n=1 Tax=Acanthaster planci TaxID=133434 RepID=A0A8B7ZA51_ACAPL|nr:hyalin-like [Acanthaster planci]